MTEELRTCGTCNQPKVITEFYTQPVNHCKSCVRQKVKNYRDQNIDVVKERDRARSSKPHRVAARQAYADTPAGREVNNKAKRDWQARNQDKRAAHVLLGNSVRDGKVIKPEVCDRCSKGGRIHAHHHDYSRPLDVDWLCPACHAAEHKLQRVAPC